MKLYRVCDNDEIETLYEEKSFNNLGEKYEINSSLNTHKYMPNKKYLHFFKNKEDILYLDTFKNKFVCEYDIPNNALKGAKGFAYYYDLLNFTELQKIPEYAIENNLLNFEYLKSVEKIFDFIDIDNISNEKLEDHLEPYYLSDVKKEKKLVLKMGKNN